MSELKRISYIEDEVDIQSIAKICLENYGNYEVSIFGNASEALAGLAAAKPDLILLDFMLPEMDGKQLYSKIRELEGFESVPMVFLTAKNSFIENPDELLELGAAGVLGKPFDPITLTQSIEDIWKNHVKSN